MGVPFGIRPRDLELELKRRERMHRRHMAPRLARLKRLRNARAQCEEYARLLTGEAEHLQAEQQSLLRQLAGGPQDWSEAKAVLQERTNLYRQQQRNLLEAVMSLITPYLIHPDLPQSTRGAPAWPRVRPDEHTGSGAQ